MNNQSKYRRAGFLTLLAILLVGGAYWNYSYGRIRLPFAFGPYHLVLDKIEVVTPLPRDVARGYDTVIELEATGHGKKPPVDGFRAGYTAKMSPLYLYTGDRRQPISSKVGYPELILGGSSIKARILFKLANLPDSSEAVSLRGELIEENEYRGNSEIIHHRYKLPFSITVRQPHQKINSPVVSRACPLKVQSATIESVDSRTTPDNKDKRLTLVLYATDPDASQTDFRDINSHIVAERGGRFSRVSDPKGQLTILSGRSFRMDEKARPDLAEFTYDYSQKALPKDQGTLWIEDSFSFKNCWPLRVRVLIYRSKASDPKVGTVRSELWPSEGNELPRSKLRGIDRISGV